VTGFAQDGAGVDVRLSDGASLRAQYLVGCDGGRSLVRKEAGVEFPGWEPTTSSLIAEVEMAEPPLEWGIRRDARGVHALGRVEYEIRNGQIVYADKGPVGVMVSEARVGATTEPTLGDLQDALIAVYGTDYGVHSPTSISRFTDVTRQAAAYRAGRVLLAGDAAHVHSPVGGQGLNVGLQDAVNLGWKLAQVVKGTSPETLLDTYHSERHPVGARVLKTTMAQVALLRVDDRTEASSSMARTTVEECARVDVRELSRARPLIGDEWLTPWGEVLGLTRTKCHFGGSRPWLLCPVGHCGRRCGVLYRMGRRFACRRCYGLAYRTQHEQPDGRLLLKAERIWRRLGCVFGDEPQRPKGMHRRTFQRLADAAAAAYMGSFNTGRLGQLLAKADRRARS
jgi:hypothetical protein